MLIANINPVFAYITSPLLIVSNTLETVDYTQEAVGDVAFIKTRALYVNRISTAKVSYLASRLDVLIRVILFFLFFKV